METLSRASKPPKEKRRNNEKRKEKSRDAARCRRSKETEIFNELGGALPLTSEQISQLDKASVMRLAISYLKVRDMISLVPVLAIKDQKLQKLLKLKDESVFSKSLEGFVLVLSIDGDFIYLSENVSDYLGITQVDLMGQNIFEYSHPCDHEEIREMISSKKEGDVEALKSAFIRFKCTLTNKGRSVNLKSATYKVIHCTGHMIRDPSKHEESNVSKMQSYLVAVGQPIPHPSNIDTPLPRQTFLTKHNLDMKFTHADDKFMTDILGYTSEDLLDKSVFEFHHALDSEAVGAAYKCLFNKGQCETSRYRFLAKTGGYCWVLTQATLIIDKVQKPQSVVCVNHVISDVENKDEIYALHQLTAAKVKEAKNVTSDKVIPEKRVELVKEEPQKVQVEEKKSSAKRNVPVSITDKLFRNCAPISSTEKLFSTNSNNSVVSEPILTTRKPSNDVINGAKPPEVISGPHTSTKSIFAPRTEDMNKGFLAYHDKEPVLTIMKEDPEEDLTHLAPDAGEVMIDLDDNPLLTNDYDNIDWIKPWDSSFVPFLEGPSDPIFCSYRDSRDDSTPQLLSPNLSKSPDYSLPSLGSPNGSLSDDDQMSSFMNLQMDDYDSLSKAPYIAGEDSPLFMPGSELLWTNNEKNKDHIPDNSSLAELLSSSVNKHIRKQSDHGGGTTLERQFLEVSNNSDENDLWSSKQPIKIEVDTFRSTPPLERVHSIKRHNPSSCYDHQSKRSRQEPKSTELLQQLMSNNHHRGKPKYTSSSQPSRTTSPCMSTDSGTSSPGINMDTSPIMDQSERSRLPPKSPQNVIKAQASPNPVNTRKYTNKEAMTIYLIEQQQLVKRRIQEEKKKKEMLRKNSITCLLAGISDIPNLTQQDCEVNAPVNNHLLQGEELIWALDVTSKNV